MSKDNKALPTVDIKGKPYVLTQHRLLEFHRLYPNGSINTEIISDTQDSVVMVTTVVPDVKVPERAFTGIAQETLGSTFINKTSHYENCETSSRARALSNLGIGVEESCASAEEVANAVIQQNEQNTIDNLRKSIHKFVKLHIDSQSWIGIAVDLGVIDPEKYQQSLNKMFVGKTTGIIETNISNFEKQLSAKQKQLNESEKFINYKKQVEHQQKKVKIALESFDQQNGIEVVKPSKKED